MPIDSGPVHIKIQELNYTEKRSPQQRQTDKYKQEARSKIGYVKETY